MTRLDNLTIKGVAWRFKDFGHVLSVAEVRSFLESDDAFMQIVAAPGYGDLHMQIPLSRIPFGMDGFYPLDPALKPEVIGSWRAPEFVGQIWVQFSDNTTRGFGRLHIENLPSRR